MRINAPAGANLTPFVEDRLVITRNAQTPAIVAGVVGRAQVVEKLEKTNRPTFNGQTFWALNLVKTPEGWQFRK